MKHAVSKDRIKKGQVRVFRLALFLLATFVAVNAASRRAEAKEGDHGAGIGIGQVMLMGDWAEPVDDAIGFNLKYSYEASALFGVMADLHYSSHSNATGTDTLGIKGFTPNLRVNMAYIDKLVIYGFTGFGLFMIDQTRGQESASGITLGFDLGASANLALNEHFQFGTQFAFHNIFEKTATTTTTGGATSTMSLGGTFLMMSLNLMYIF